MSNKAELFRQSWIVFITHVVNSNRDAYTHLVTRRDDNDKDGYRVALESFYKTTGRLTAEQRDALYNENVIPEFAFNAIKDAEMEMFGITLINHR